MSKTPQFQVLDLTILQDAGALKAYATVSLADLIIIREVRVLKEPGQPSRCLLPQKTFIDDSGSRRFSTILSFTSRDWRDSLTEAVLLAWHANPNGFTQIPTTSAVDSPPAHPASFGDAVRERAGLGPRR